EGVGKVADLRADGELDRLTAEVSVAVLERRAEALARRESGAQIEVLRDAFLHFDDDDLAPRKNLRILERDRNAREGAERRDSLFALAHVARAVGLAFVDAPVARTALEAHAPQDERRVGALGAADDDAVDVDALAFADDEAGAPARAVGGE